MPKLCTVEVNGERFRAYRGDVLLDAALASGVDIPHDCRSGICGTCSVRVLTGRFFGGETANSDVVQACRCRVVSDMSILVEKVPDIVEVSGCVSNLVQRAEDVVEVCVTLPQPVAYLPGQYFSVQFRGFPARCYSPTVPLDWPSDARPLRFHVRQVDGGRISSALGSRIVEGRRVKLNGPFGSAYLRRDHGGRMVLVASGTGFAPIWAIAEAAIRERPKRELVLIVGARTLDSLYMIPALCRLALFPGVTIVPVVSERQSMSRAVHVGRPTDYMPALSPSDVVYAAGAPAMVEAVARMAKAAGASCFSDPFEPSPAGESGPGILSRAAVWLSAERQASPPLSMADWTFEDPSIGRAIPALADASRFRARSAADGARR